MEDKKIVICAGPGSMSLVFTEEQEEEMRVALERMLTERLEEELKLKEIANSVIYTTLESDKDQYFNLKQRLKYAKNPMEVTQIQREMGQLSKYIGKKGRH